MLGRVLGVVSAAAVLAAMTGCGVGNAAGGGVAQPMALAGHAMGGEQPVTGAHVVLYAANTSGYNGASVSAMTSTVTSGVDGGFTLTGTYHCNSTEDLVYLVATHGSPGFSTPMDNGQIALMAALGRCGDLQPTTNIVINEVTTVAAAWALAQFMPTYDHLATSPTNITGLKNAFAMAANLANTSNGSSPGNAPANAVVPNDEINTLANALAACVSSTGGAAGDANNCGTLMTAAKVGGTAPTNIADAALNIARHPGQGMSALYGLSAGIAPFQPTLGSQPNDWTISVSFPVGPTVATNIAIDASGNVWAAATDGLYELNAAGFQQTSYPSLAGNSVALDPSGNIWVALSNSSAVAKLPANLSSPSTFSVATTGSGTGVGSLAVDGSGNPWYTCQGCLNVYELNPDGTQKAVSPSNGGGLVTTALSIDPSENVWAGNFTYSGYYVYKPDATLYSNSEPYSCGSNCGVSAFIANDHAGQGWFVGHDLTIVSAIGGTLTDINSPSGGIFNPAAVAIDGSGAAWVANTNNILSLTPGAATTAGSISQFDTNGVALSPNTGYSSATLSTPQGIAVDGSGNVWLRNTGAATVTVFVGAATPVVTPFSLGLKNGTLGQKP